MRHVPFSALLVVATLGVGGGLAFATPFEPKRIPDQVQAVAHLDVDALRRTQLFTAAGAQALPLSSRQGVFVFVTLGDHLLNALQKTAHSKMLQLGLRSVVVDVSEAAGQLTATVHAEMRSADAVQKATSMLEGLRAMA